MTADYLPFFVFVGCLPLAAPGRSKVVWTVVNEGGNGTKGEIDLYKNAEWAKPYDVIIHNECFADTTNANYIRNITAAHKAGKPAVVIHCAMHTYRSWKADDWREFLGVTQLSGKPRITGCSLATTFTGYLLW